MTYTSTLFQVSSRFTGSIVSDIDVTSMDNNVGFDNRVISRWITQTLNMVKTGIINNMSRKKKIASGLTTNSLKVVRDTPVSGFITSMSKGLEYAETGRTKGRGPKNFDAIIKKWMLDKGITPNHVDYKPKNPNRVRLTDSQRDLNRAAHNIAHYIVKHGTVQHRKGWTNVYTHEVSNAKVFLRQRLAGYTQLSVRNFFKQNLNNKKL